MSLFLGKRQYDDDAELEERCRSFKTTKIDMESVYGLSSHLASPFLYPFLTTRDFSKDFSKASFWEQDGREFRRGKPGLRALFFFF